jgi:hypothetical protein
MNYMWTTFFKRPYTVTYIDFAKLSLRAELLNG